MVKEDGGASADGGPTKGKPKKKQKESAIIGTSNDGHRNVLYGLVEDRFQGTQGNCVHIKLERFK